MDEKQENITKCCIVNREYKPYITRKSYRFGRYNELVHGNPPHKESKDINNLLIDG